MNVLLRPAPTGEVGVTPAQAGWRYLSFRARRLNPGEELRLAAGPRELAVVLLSGTMSVTAGSDRWTCAGRSDVWERVPPWAVLVPPYCEARVAAVTHAHVALVEAPAERGFGPRVIRPDEVVIEERGAGNTARTIHHILPPSVPAARLILVEVYTPGGNWSSFPPHKHDTEEPPHEAYLEEVYYYQIHPSTGFALQRVYTPDGSLDASVAVRDGDLVCVPRGYHPVAATPGFDCYYLNAMAGHRRAWNFRVDPVYAHLMNWQKPEVAQETRMPGEARGDSA
ncbi:MAG TPA: 5-deoxy-glucuronate isomerase [Limnochordales bacterium]